VNAIRGVAIEFRLLLRSRFAWVLVALPTVCALLGMRAVDHSNDMQFHGMGRTSLTMSLGAAQYAAMAGAPLAAMLTLLVLSRDRRQRSRALLEAAGGYGRVAAGRIVALLALGLLSAIAACAASLPAHRLSSSAPIEFLPYGFSTGAILLPAIWFAILIAAALELAFENLDIAFLSFGALYVVGVSSPDYLLRWVQSGVSVYSDFGGIEPVGRLVAYNRLFWALLVTAMVLAGFLCRRLPGFSLRASMARHAGRGMLPTALLAAIASAAAVHANEPHLFPNDSAFRRDLPRSGQVWLQTLECHTQLRPQTRTLAATVRYGFGKEAPPAAIEFITNTGLHIEALTVNGAEAAWERVPQTDRIGIQLPAGARADVEIRYRGAIRYPGPGTFPGYITGRSVYLLENSHWLFEPLTGARGPIEVSGSVRAPAHWTVISPGRMEATTTEGAERTWRFAGAFPKPAIGLFAAEYVCETFEAGPATVEFYFSPRHAAYIRAAEIAGHIRDMVTFYTDFIGLPPCEDMPIRIVETSVYKPGGHASLNVVTVAEYLLNRAKAVDPTTNPRFILRDLNILAHELAHQWWGSGVAFAETGDWSSEGFAEYMAYKYLTARYPAGITENLLRGWRGSVAGQQNAYYRKDPAVLDRMRPALRERLLREEVRSRAYSVLPLDLLAAEERASPEDVRARLAELFLRYRGRMLEHRDFNAVMGAVLGESAGERE
jgi:hypothetical protein